MLSAVNTAKSTYATQHATRNFINRQIQGFVAIFATGSIPIIRLNQKSAVLQQKQPQALKTKGLWLFLFLNLFYEFLIYCRKIHMDATRCNTKYNTKSPYLW